MHYSLEYNLQKYVLLVTSENDCISVTFQRLNLEASKAVTSETLFISETSEIAIQNSSKKELLQKKFLQLQLYTTNEIPQL